jgi:SAM-dependent methyltransferase
LNLLRRAYLRAIVPPNPFRMDPELDALVLRLCLEVRPGSRVLNLGARATTYPGPVVNLDLEAFPGVHVCGDGAKLPFGNRTFSVVLLRGVLEHVRLPEAVMLEVERVLEPRGQVYVEVPFLQPFHASPEDHRRFTLPGLRAFLAGFEEVRSGVQIGPLSALAWTLPESVSSLLAFGSPSAYRLVRIALGWSTFWLKYLDRLVVPGPFVAHSASALYFLGRRRG